MKVKLNLDKNAIKNFFIDHTEKVVFGLVLLGVVLIVYSAVSGREKTDKNPEDLLAKVNAAKTGIEQSQPVAKKIVEIDKITALSHEPIKVEGYELTKPISPPIGKLEHPRGEPPVLAVEKLRAAAGTGMFQIITAAKTAGGERGGGTLRPEPANPGVSDQRGERWAVLTALVPMKKQSDLYRDTFCDCRHLDPVKDSVPEYKGYWVERLEISSPADIKNPDWNNTKKVTKFRSDKEEKSVTKDWGQATQPPRIDLRFINSNLCFPLGPLTGASWDASVAHEPEIPILTNDMFGGAPIPPSEAAPEKKPADAEPFADQAGTPEFGGALGGSRGGMPVGPPGGYSGMNPFGGRGQMPAGMMQGGMAMDPNATEYLLFRFFDFTVEPGKRYIYRVKLALSNPNYDVKTVFLEKPEFAKHSVLMNANWSEPSPVINIPNDTSTLAIAVEQPRRVIGDPLGSMLIALWQQDTGKKVYNEFAVERGQLLNFPDAEVLAVQTALPAMPSAAADKTALLSNVLVVDMAGGKKLPTVKPKPPPEETTDQFNKKLPAKGKDRSAYSPGDILVMEPDGTLVVRDEFEDMASVEKFSSKPEQSAPGLLPGMRGMPPGYGPGMPPGYGPGMPPGYGPGMPPGYGPGMPPGYGPGMPPGYGPGAGRGGAARTMPDLFNNNAGGKQAPSPRKN